MSASIWSSGCPRGIVLAATFSPKSNRIAGKAYRRTYSNSSRSSVAASAPNALVKAVAGTAPDRTLDRYCENCFARAGLPKLR